MTIRRSVAVLGLLLMVSVARPLTVTADPVSDFYRGKTLNMLVGVGAGGEYDLLARTLAKHIGRHLPGHPTVVTQNMVGGERAEDGQLHGHAGAAGWHVYRRHSECADRRPGRRPARRSVRCR